MTDLKNIKNGLKDTSIQSDKLKISSKVEYTSYLDLLNKDPVWKEAYIQSWVTRNCFFLFPFLTYDNDDNKSCLLDEFIKTEWHKSEKVRFVGII